MMDSTLRGAMVSLRPATTEDIPALARIRATPEAKPTWCPRWLQISRTPKPARLR